MFWLFNAATADNGQRKENRALKNYTSHSETLIGWRKALTSPEVRAAATANATNEELAFIRKATGAIRNTGFTDADCINVMRIIGQCLNLEAVLGYGTLSNCYMSLELCKIETEINSTASTCTIDWTDPGPPEQDAAPAVVEDPDHLPDDDDTNVVDFNGDGNRTDANTKGSGPDPKGAMGAKGSKGESLLFPNASNENGKSSKGVGRKGEKGKQKGETGKQTGETARTAVTWFTRDEASRTWTQWRLEADGEWRITQEFSMDGDVTNADPAHQATQIVTDTALTGDQNSLSASNHSAAATGKGVEPYNADPAPIDNSQWDGYNTWTDGNEHFATQPHQFYNALDFAPQVGQVIKGYDGMHHRVEETSFDGDRHFTQENRPIFPDRVNNAYDAYYSQPTQIQAGILDETMADNSPEPTSFKGKKQQHFSINPGKKGPNGKPTKGKPSGPYTRNGEPNRAYDPKVTYGRFSQEEGSQPLGTHSADHTIGAALGANAARQLRNTGYGSNYQDWSREQTVADLLSPYSNNAAEYSLETFGPRSELSIFQNGGTSYKSLTDSSIVTVQGSKSLNPCIFRTLARVMAHRAFAEHELLTHGKMVTPLPFIRPTTQLLMRLPEDNPGLTENLMVMRQIAQGIPAGTTSAFQELSVPNQTDDTLQVLWSKTVEDKGFYLQVAALVTLCMNSTTLSGVDLKKLVLPNVSTTDINTLRTSIAQMATLNPTSGIVTLCRFYQEGSTSENVKKQIRASSILKRALGQSEQCLPFNGNQPSQITWLQQDLEVIATLPAVDVLFLSMAFPQKWDLVTGSAERTKLVNVCSSTIQTLSNLKKSTDCVIAILRAAAYHHICSSSKNTETFLEATERYAKHFPRKEPTTNAYDKGSSWKGSKGYDRPYYPKGKQDWHDDKSKGDKGKGSPDKEHLTFGKKIWGLYQEFTPAVKEMTPEERKKFFSRKDLKAVGMTYDESAERLSIDKSYCSMNVLDGSCTFADKCKKWHLKAWQNNLKHHLENAAQTE